MIRVAATSRCLAWVVTAAAVMTLGCFEPSFQSDEGAADAEIDRTLAEWAAGFERGDSTALIVLVSEGAEFWTHGAPPIIGREQLEGAFEAFFVEFSAVQRFVELDRTVAGDVAFLRGEEVNTLTPRSGGEAFEYRQRAFSVLRREGDGRWRFWRGMTNQGPVVAVESLD